MTLKAVGYIRVSSEEQVDGYSLDAQRREIAAFCERQSYDLVTVYSDEGVSAYTDLVAKRPAFARLLDDAVSGAFGIVVVHTLDRWARRASVQAASLERLGKAGVGFASTAEQLDFTTPAGRLMLSVIGGVSEFFSGQLGVHVSKSKRERAERGLPAGPIPFGYEVHEPGGIPLLNDAAASAVRRAFLRRASGDSYGSIASALNEEGHATRTRAGILVFRGERHVVLPVLPRRSDVSE